MRIIKEILKFILVTVGIFLFLLACWEETNSHYECEKLEKAGYTVKRSLFDCEVLIHDTWMDSEEFFQKQFNKTSTTFLKKVDTFQI